MVSPKGIVSFSFFNRISSIFYHEIDRGEFLILEGSLRIKGTPEKNTNRVYWVKKAKRKNVTSPFIKFLEAQ